MKRIMDTVKIALEKQIPKKPVNKRYVDYDDIKNLLMGHCPACKWNVTFYERYCSNCGQKLDWDTTEIPYF